MANALLSQDYLRQADRKDSYIRYIYVLVNEHLKSQRCVEAAYTILLHADLLEWRDDKILEKQGDYGRQTERERKVRRANHFVNCSCYRTT